VRSKFFFPAKVSQVAGYAFQVTEALGEGFQGNLVTASISEALLNAVMYGALGLKTPEQERDPEALEAAIQDAESRAGTRVGVTVQVVSSEDDPYEKAVVVRDPGPGFEWRERILDLADGPVSVDPLDLASNGRGIALMLAGAQSVTWNDLGNEATLRFRSADAPESHRGVRPPPSAFGKPSPLVDISAIPTVRTSSSTQMLAQRSTPVPASLNRAERTAEPATISEPPPSSSGLGGRVMVVDDMDVARRVLQRVLELEGYEVRTARDGYAAVELTASFRPNVVIMDYDMPGMTGIATVAHMRDRGLLSNASVILMTSADVDDETRAAGLDAGASDFVEKPISRRELTARVRRMIATRESMRAMEEERDRLHDSLTAAAQVMLALMPEAHIPCGRSTVSTLVIPSELVGGDFVDVVRVRPTQWCAMLVDVAGHGLAAALTATAARAILRDQLAEGRTISQSISALNARLAEDFDRTGQHAAVTAVLIDEGAGRVDIVNAGCPPAVVFLRDGSQSLFPSEAMPAGLLEGITYESASMDIREMRRMVFVSDGIAEGFATPSNTMLALQRMLKTENLAAFAALPESAIRRAVARLGRDRDDASIVWIDFHTRTSGVFRDLSRGREG